MCRSVFVLLLAFLALACASHSAKDEEISRERAIEIARQHLTFEAKSVEAERTTEQDRPVWRVTFRGREADPPHLMGEFLVVTIDRKTGELVTIGMA